VLRLIPFAYMPSPIPRQVRWKLIRSYRSIVFGLPRIGGGSAPALSVSRPAQRLLTLRPACSPSRLCDPLHRRLQQLRCLRCCFDCYRVERTSSRAGLPPLWISAFSRRTPITRLTQQVKVNRLTQERISGLIVATVPRMHSGSALSCWRESRIMTRWIGRHKPPSRNSATTAGQASPPDLSPQ
jgi:hypothetical protein